MSQGAEGIFPHYKAIQRGFYNWNADNSIVCNEVVATQEAREFCKLCIIFHARHIVYGDGKHVTHKLIDLKDIYKSTRVVLQQFTTKCSEFNFYAVIRHCDVNTC